MKIIPTKHLVKDRPCIPEENKLFKSWTVGQYLERVKVVGFRKEGDRKRNSILWSHRDKRADETVGSIRFQLTTRDD